MIFHRQLQAKAPLFLAAVLIAAPVGCKKQPPPANKVLRMQLAHELRHHSYDKALPIARRLIELTPQDNSAWKRLAQAQFGLRDFDGASQTLIEWRRTIAARSSTLCAHS